jgi:hypothetical protein
LILIGDPLRIQPLEERCGTRFEEIPAERYGGKRPEMPELRT